MTIAEAIAAEFQVEAAATRRFLERFEEKHADWQPHEKSMTLSRLAIHVVECPDWAYTVLDADDFDFATMDYEPPHWKTRDELLENHERIGAGFLKQFEGRSNDAMRANWRLRQGDHVLMDTTREAAVRNIILSHLVHHRGQLSVYYRLLGIPIPGPYGPSADDRDE
jgi:uncharacterized damage-inducible protein DinB